MQTMRVGLWALALVACSGAPAKKTSGGRTAAPEREEAPTRDTMLDSDKQQELNSYFRNRRRSVLRCYTQAVDSGAADGKSSGQVTVEMTISAQGAPRNVRIVKDTLKNDAVASCITELVPTWEAPPPGTTIQYSFTYAVGPE